MDVHKSWHQHYQLFLIVSWWQVSHLIKKLSEATDFDFLMLFLRNFVWHVWLYVSLKSWSIRLFSKISLVFWIMLPGQWKYFKSLVVNTLRKTCLLCWNHTYADGIARLNVRTIGHAWDLQKLAWSCNQFCLWCLPDPWNLLGTALFSGFQSSWGALKSTEYDST